MSGNRNVPRPAPGSSGSAGPPPQLGEVEKGIVRRVQVQKRRHSRRRGRRRQLRQHPRRGALPDRAVQADDGVVGIRVRRARLPPNAPLLMPIAPTLRCVHERQATDALERKPQVQLVMAWTSATLNRYGPRSAPREMTPATTKPCPARSLGHRRHAERRAVREEHERMPPCRWLGIAHAAQHPRRCAGCGAFERRRRRCIEGCLGRAAEPVVGVQARERLERGGRIAAGCGRVKDRDRYRPRAESCRIAGVGLVPARPNRDARSNRQPTGEAGCWVPASVSRPEGEGEECPHDRQSSHAATAGTKVVTAGPSIPRNPRIAPPWAAGISWRT